MIDISKLTYKVFLLRETGEQLDVSSIAENVMWEENEGELAMRVSLSLANVLHNGQRMSSIAKPNCYLIITAENQSGVEEVARAKITEWEPTRSGSGDSISLSGYDELFELQSSQDNRYLADGTSTRTAILSVFEDWGVPVGEYKGPSDPTAKLTYKNEYLSDIILDLLNTAVEHGASKCVIRASKGKVSILPRASNETVYRFEEGGNLETTQYKISTGDMVTVVKVVAPEDDEERQKVEAIVEGKTEYGKRQRIYVRDKEDDLATATAAAQQILAEDGEPEESFSVKAPDVPYIRKGDMIMVETRVYTGYAIVLSIQHDASGRSMSMDLLPYDPVPVGE